MSKEEVRSNNVTTAAREAYYAYRHALDLHNERVAQESVAKELVADLNVMPEFAAACGVPMKEWHLFTVWVGELAWLISAESESADRAEELVFVRAINECAALAESIRTAYIGVIDRGVCQLL